MPNIRWLLNIITVLHRWIYRASAGAVGHTIGKRTFLLLSSVGLKSGRSRTTPLLFVEDGRDWIVVASNAGDDRAPAWWLNLQANPETFIQVGARTVAVRARKAGPDECGRLWPILEDAYNYFPKYRERTSREIPVIVLEPRTPQAGESSHANR